MFDWAHNSSIKIKINLHFYFHSSLWCLKGFTKALNAFIKPLQAPQGSMKIKIWVNFLTSSEIGTGKVNTPLQLLTWTRLRPMLSLRKHKQLPAVLFKKSVLKNFATFTEKHLYWSLFLIKLQAWRPAILLKRDSNTGLFLWITRNF